jgi:MHS family proline/betaine transporter-like MFS transporter
MYIANILSLNFLSHFSHQNSAFNYYLIFALGYLVRPFGAIFFGRYADKKGRKPALLLSIKILVIVGVLISILPTYHQIGMLAPIALLVLRGCQGFAMGGEFTAILTLMVENSSKKRQGRSIALMETSAIIGMLLSASCFFLISHLFSHAFVVHYGWRLCFVLGSIILVSVYYVQNHLPESYQYLESKKSAPANPNYLKTLVRYYKTELLTAFVLMVSISVTYSFVMTYLVNNYLPTHTPIHHLQIIIILGIICQYPACYLGGYLNDTLGSAKSIFILISVLMLALLPLSTGLHHDTTGWYYLALVVFMLAPTVPILVYINNIFPVHFRCIAVFLCYNTANAIFCGLMPSFSLLIFDKTHHLNWIYIVIVASQVLALASLVACQLKNHPADNLREFFLGKQNLAI